MFDIPPFKDYIVVDTFNVHELCKKHKAKMVALYLKKRKKVPIGVMNEEYCNKDFIKAISALFATMYQGRPSASRETIDEIVITLPQF